MALTSALPVWMTPHGVRPRWADGIEVRNAEDASRLFQERFDGHMFQPEDPQVLVPSKV